MPKPQPNNNINDFLEACKENRRQPASVALEGRVRESAAKDFSLKTREALLAFIAGGGLENLEFVNSIPYRLSDEIPPPFCDAYTFRSGFAIGYVSFFYSEPNKRWIIKSFHRSDACGPTAMELAFRKAGLFAESLKGSE